jgi:hypothetical protein
MPSTTRLSVAEASDVAHIRGSQEAVHLCRLVMCFEHYDGRVAPAAEATVDTISCFQEPRIDRKELLLDPFRVVQSIHAYGQAARLNGRRLARPPIRPFDRHRIGTNRHPSIAAGDEGVPAVDVDVERTLDGVDEILTIVRRLESNDRAAEETGHSVSTSSHTAAANRAFTALYRLKSSDRNTSWTRARWHRGQRPSFANP